MSKYVIYTETRVDKRNTHLKKWVGRKVINLFPNQPVYLENVDGGRRLVTEEDKQYILQNGDNLYSAIRPSGGVIDDLLRNASATILAPVNPTRAFKRASTYASKVFREVSRIFTPTINDPNFEGDERRNRPQITGASNTTSRELVPFIFGETRMTPFYGQQAYRIVQDGSSLNKLNQYFVCGMNNFTFSDEKLGETRLTDYSTDSVSRQFAFGTTTNLSNPSVMPVEKSEQLSYDKEKIVNQSSSFIYNAAVNNNTLTYELVLEFRNAVPTDWSTKTFRVEISYYKNNDTSTILTATHDFVVTDVDLVLVSGKTYTYNNNFVEVLGGADVFTTILESRVFPTGSTRNTSSEISQELECELDSEEITCGAFNQNVTLNNPVNNYTGVVSAVVDTSKANVKDIDINFSFPQGMYKQQNDGSRISRSTKVDIQIKAEGGEYNDLDQFNLYIRDIDGNKQPLSTTNTTVNGSEVTFSSPVDIKNADELFYRTIGIEVPVGGKYTTRIRSADFADKTNFDIGYPQVEFINYWYNENAVNSQIFPKVVQINLQATATNELSGTLQQYNFIGKSILNVWNGTDWNDLAITSNPAAVIRYVLLNDLVNIRAEDEEIIDNDSLVELYEYCEANDFKVSGVISQQYKVESFLDTVLDSCRSIWTINNGKFYFASDKDKAPRQMFTQHNTYNFVSNPTLGENVTALRMTYLDNVDWIDKEFTVYWYDGAAHDMPKINTTDADYRILKQDIDFINELDNAKEIAKYRLELIQAKRRNYTFSVNIESMNLNLLDRVLVSDTVNMQNSSTGMIKELVTSGGNITGFKIYSRIDIPANSNITIRSLNQTTEQIEINSYQVANSGNSDIIELTSPILNNGVIQGKGKRNGLNKYSKWDYDGDMFEIGQGNIVTCTIDGINFNDDLTATITAREA